MGHSDQAGLMDRMYRTQRHFYDITRKYYLLGRDRLLETLPSRPGARILEVGCGTGRNLLRLHRQAPGSRLYGIDISDAMLATARRKLARRGLSEIRLARCAAEALAPDAPFADGGPYDIIYFSYTLSMIPSWPAALQAALDSLGTDGALHVVDFWDQADLPGWFRSLLQRWLGWFHVHPRPDLLQRLQELGRAPGVTLDLEPLYRRYAYLARLEMAPG